MGSLHINANKEDVAKIVLMPGDPLRAQYFAEKYLDDYKKVCDTRNLFGFTGYTKQGHNRISIIASGMGQASIGIYSYELFTYYDVDIIIRVGTCGTYQKECNYYDLIIASSAITDSNWGNTTIPPQEYYIEEADKELVDIFSTKSNKPYKVHIGQIYTGDVFYDEDPNFWKRWADKGVLGVEMEAYALFKNAHRCHKKALALFVVTDSFVAKPEEVVKLSPEDRQTKTTAMAEYAIEKIDQYL